jgi:hypothetical protein
MDLSKLANLLKLQPVFLLGILLTSSMLLFGPTSLLDLLGLSEIVIIYRGWIGLSLLFSVSLLGAHLMCHVFTTYIY